MACQWVLIVLLALSYVKVYTHLQTITLHLKDMVCQWVLIVLLILSNVKVCTNWQAILLIL